MNERAKEVNPRVEQVWKEIDEMNCPWGESIRKVLSALPEFNPPKQEWVKCSDRMPEKGAFVYINVFNKPIIRAANYDGDVFFSDSQCYHHPVDVFHWMPRIVPAPPVEEDSELVKQLVALQKQFSPGTIEFDTYKRAIKIVKEFERKK